MFPQSGGHRGGGLEVKLDALLMWLSVGLALVTGWSGRGVYDSGQRTPDSRYFEMRDDVAKAKAAASDAELNCIARQYQDLAYGVPRNPGDEWGEVCIYCRFDGGFCEPKTIRVGRGPINKVVPP
jgi:hypothetical protein